jgi:phenylpropionate dioxygenase-like ring-hydroxylating dioxygenase large terminal subunit
MPEAPFLRNAWYAVATSDEAREAPLGRRICNEPVVIFRRADGNAAMLDDRCPHRVAILAAKEPGTVTTLDVPMHILYNGSTPETERLTH